MYCALIQRKTYNIIRGGGISAYDTNNFEHPLIMIIDLYTDDIDERNRPKPSSPETPGGIRPNMVKNPKK